VSARKNVLILCTGNSARSIMAEAILNSIGAGHFVAYSAGSRPAGYVHPAALRQLEAAGLPTEGLRSKSWLEFSGPAAPSMDVVITVCDNAANENCPVWPGAPLTAHWSMPDPAQASSHGDERGAFADAYRILRHRMAMLVRPPISGLGRAVVQERLRSIAAALPSPDEDLE
jgi:protein-tyrosine-phosphatase